MFNVQLQFFVVLIYLAEAKVICSKVNLRTTQFDNIRFVYKVSNYFRDLKNDFLIGRKML